MGSGGFCSFSQLRSDGYSIKQTADDHRAGQAGCRGRVLRRAPVMEWSSTPRVMPLCSNADHTGESRPSAGDDRSINAGGEMKMVVDQAQGSGAQRPRRQQGSGFSSLPSCRLLGFKRAGDLLVKLKQERYPVAVPAEFPLGVSGVNGGI